MAIFAKRKYLKLAKGFRGRAKNCPRIMMPRVEKSLQHAYVGRKLRLRNHRREWIMAINSGVREHSVSYSQFIYGLNRSNISLDRKILASLAVNEPYSFKAIVDEIKTQTNLKGLYKDDMDFIEAIDRNYLVYGPVKELPKQSNFTIPFIVPRTAIPEKMKGKMHIINQENHKFKPE